MKAVKILLSFVLAVSTLLTINLSSASASTSFKDVSSSFRAYKEITYLAQGKIVLGDKNGNYNPFRTVTRAEAAAMIGRALGLSGTQRNTVFKDVTSGNFASGYIMAAYESGIISGYSDGSFNPSANVTRGEMALLISRAFGYTTNNTMASAIEALKSRGIAKGLTNGEFGDNQSITRADFAVFLARAINYSLRVTPTLPTTNEYLYVNTATLNVRTGPSTNYPSIGSIKRGTQVQVAYRVGAWTMIKSGTTIGFVNNGYLAKAAVSDPLSELTLVIDPGHGGKDPGAIGLGANEKDVVLQTSLYLQQYLANTPINVEMTRSTDVFIELADRVAYATEMNGSAFVSIHANAFNGSASGSETYYYSAAVNPHSEDSELLATYIQKRVVAAMGTKDRGVKEAGYYVIKYNTMPAALVELGFIDNADDNAKLISTTYQQKAAKAIFYGILDYYGSKGYNVSSYY
ncbi:MAG: N-acetylmuramoyl-L-alanine amidase [Bacillus sp. (in: firmicutes)]